MLDTYDVEFSPMDTFIISPRELFHAYRETIKTVPNNIVKRKTVDDTLVNESCLICSEDFLRDTEGVTLRCSCRYWAHESCLGQSIFTTDRCPICRIDTLLLDDEYVLASAAREGNLDQVQRLLDLGTNHSPRDLADGTPLIGAAREGHGPIVSLLLQQGASVFDHDRANQTALHWAAERGHVEVAEELLDNGADLSAVDRKGSTPLHLGAANRFPAMVSLLLERGASTSAKDGDAKTPLHVAAEVGVTETVMILIQKGADVLSVDEQGRTPLHCAVQLGYAAVTKSLLDRGADISVMDHTGRTARDIAREREADRIQRVLDGEEVELRAFFREELMKFKADSIQTKTNTEELITKSTRSKGMYYALADPVKRINRPWDVKSDQSIAKIRRITAGLQRSSAVGLPPLFTYTCPASDRSS
jgi:ankyrin repeat protein